MSSCPDLKSAVYSRESLFNMQKCPNLNATNQSSRMYTDQPQQYVHMYNLMQSKH